MSIKNVVASLLMVRAHLHHLLRTAPAPTYRCLLPVAGLQPAASASVPTAAMSTAAQEVADQKRALRTEARKALKALTPDQRASEGDSSRLP
jgi:5-formyltetrahydrofolate cyclo-ligase